MRRSFQQIVEDPPGHGVIIFFAPANQQLAAIAKQTVGIPLQDFFQGGQRAGLITPVQTGLDDLIKGLVKQPVGHACQRGILLQQQIVIGHGRAVIVLVKLRVGQFEPRDRLLGREAQLIRGGLKIRPGRGHVGLRPIAPAAIQNAPVPRANWQENY